ncbi:hypothetical protein PQG92_13210 [Phocaeicola dorei]|nr:hypothetical protein [Phocaeicola dorei]
MYVYIKQPGIVCFLCWLCLSCTLQRTEHPALRQAGYLMEEHADSAFSLLKSISSLIGMTPEDKADYALLLAEAADKNGYSLLPCDSLLNLALHVYHEEAKEHAIALLYKGKVQQEMENYADALKSYRMALEILSAYPCEFYWKGLYIICWVGCMANRTCTHRPKICMSRLVIMIRWHGITVISSVHSAIWG